MKTRCEEKTRTIIPTPETRKREKGYGCGKGKNSKIPELRRKEEEKRFFFPKVELDPEGEKDEAERGVEDMHRRDNEQEQDKDRESSGYLFPPLRLARLPSHHPPTTFVTTSQDPLPQPTNHQPRFSNFSTLYECVFSKSNVEPSRDHSVSEQQIAASFFLFLFALSCVLGFSRVVSSFVTQRCLLCLHLFL